MQDAKQQRIQDRAYQIWLREGCPHGRDAEHWRQAEREIASESQRAGSAPAAATTGSAPQPSEAQPRPQSRPTEPQRHVDAPPAATPAAGGTDAAPKKRASRGKLKEDPGAATKGKPSKKHAGNGAVREPPRK